MVGEQVGLDLRPYGAGVGVELLDQEAEIRRREGGGGVIDVGRREEVSDVDRVEQHVHRTVAVEWRWEFRRKRVCGDFGSGAPDGRGDRG